MSTYFYHNFTTSDDNRCPLWLELVLVSATTRFSSSIKICLTIILSDPQLGTISSFFSEDEGLLIHLQSDYHSYLALIAKVIKGLPTLRFGRGKAIVHQSMANLVLTCYSPLLTTHLKSSPYDLTFSAMIT